MSDGTKAARFGELWICDELILAFDLYCRIPFKDTKATNPLVSGLATLLGRSAAAVARKLGNFGAFDPNLQTRGISGLTHGSHLDKEVWDAFHDDWGKLVYEAHKLRHSLCKRANDLPLTMPTGESERTVLSKQRVHQAFFRDAVLSNYECRCCITGLRLRECLVASHIIPWSRSVELRVDPMNGLCLSATFDRLFDSGLMAISQDLRVCISRRINEMKDEVVLRLIGTYDGRPILRPNRFFPRPEHLRWHRENVFSGN